MSEDEKVQRLTLRDLCDAPACDAAAYVLVTFKSGELVMCRHHSFEYADAYVPIATGVHDETWRLFEGETKRVEEGVS